MRKEFLSTLLREAMKDGKMEESTRINEIQQNEAQTKVWASIHRELNETRNTSLTKVEVPMSDGTTKGYTTKKEVEE